MFLEDFILWNILGTTWEAQCSDWNRSTVYPFWESSRGQNSTERVSSYFPSNLAGPCQTALQTMCYLTCRCQMCWCLLFSIPTVIQGVDIALLGLNNQSFARLMEQRLAPLFMMSHQQGRRFKRATTVGSYTVQVVDATSVTPRHVLESALFGCIEPEFVRKTRTGLRFPVFFHQH